MNLPRQLVALTAGTTLVLAVAAPVGAELGEGITTGKMTLRPYVDASVTYDSNAQQVPVTVAMQDPVAPPTTVADVLTEESDIYYELRAGTTLGWYDDRSAVSGDAWAFLRRYADLDLEDEEGFGERLGFARGDRETLAWRVFQSYERRFDFVLRSVAEGPTTPTLESATPEAQVFSSQSLDLEEELLRRHPRRDLFNVGFDAGRDLTDKLELDVGYSYDETDYDDETLFGSSQHTGTAGLGHQLTDKTTLRRRGQRQLPERRPLLPSPGRFAIQRLAQALLQRGHWIPALRDRRPQARNTGRWNHHPRGWHPHPGGRDRAPARIPAQSGHRRNHRRAVPR